MNKKITAMLMMAAMLSAGSAWAKDKNMIQVKGSDTMVNLAQAWAEDYMPKHPGAFIAVTGGGSGTGIAALLNGTCDIAISSREIKPKEMEQAKDKDVYPREYKVALDGLAVVVSPSNPVDKLTADQLADIFTGRVKNWKEVGGKDAAIVVLSREVNSGTHVYFKEHILRKGDPNAKDEFAPNALLLPSSQAIADEIKGNPDAIGYYGMAYISKEQKALHVAKKSGAEFIGPTAENVINGSYPISRPLFIYTNGKPTGPSKEFVEYVMSPEGQAVVAKIDFVPIVR